MHTFLFIILDYCSGGAWKLPSGKYVCFVDPAISDYNGYYEIDGSIKKNPHTTVDKQCIDNGFDHLIEPRTHEDAVMFGKLEHCIGHQKLNGLKQ